MEFNRFEFLYVLLAVFGAVLLVGRAKKKHYLAHSMNLEPLLSLMRPSSLRLLPRLLLWAGVITAGITLMDPLIRLSAVETHLEGLDIVLAVDLSSSMQEVIGGWKPPPAAPASISNATFVGSGSVLQQKTANVTPAGPPPETRMVAVKRSLLDFVARRKNDRLALVAFSQNSYVISPLTADHSYLEKYVDMLDPDVLLGEGLTAIGEGLQRSIDLFRLAGDSNARNRAIVVFTDGEQNFGRSPVEPLGWARLQGYRVYLIGIELAPEITRKAHVQELIQGVIATGGQYFDAQDKAGLQKASQSIDRLEKAIFVKRTLETNIPAYRPFVYASLALVSAALLLTSMPYFTELT